MSQHASSVPRKPLIAVGLLLAFTLAAAAAARLGGIGVVTTADAPTRAMAELRFRDDSEGRVLVHEAASGRLLQALEPGGHGFLRGTMRGLARERKARGVSADAPYRLVSRADGRLTLEDPATGRRVDLESFGPANSGVFAHLLAAATPH